MTSYAKGIRKWQLIQIELTQTLVSGQIDWFFLTAKNTSKVAIIFHGLAKITGYHQEPVTSHGIAAHGVLILVTPGVQLGWRGGNGKGNSRIIGFTRAMPFLGIFNVLFINITVVRVETITRRFQFHHIVTILFPQKISGTFFNSLKTWQMQGASKILWITTNAVTLTTQLGHR